MLNENAKKWVAALRSGEFPQAKGRLTILDANGNVTGHCCLGLACVLAKENGVILPVTDDRTRGGEHRIYAESPNVLPFAVKEWLGLSTSGGHFKPTDNKYGEQLSARNDHGASFTEIADLIESEPEGLFA